MLRRILGNPLLYLLDEDIGHAKKEGDEAHANLLWHIGITLARLFTLISLSGCTDKILLLLTLFCSLKYILNNL